MTIRTEPVPARTDTASATTTDAPGISTTTARRIGAGLAAGSLTWAVGIFAVGANPDTSLGVTIGDLSAVPFQLGVFGLVLLQLRTRATGVGRLAVGFLRLEFVLLALATLWSVLHGAVPSWRDDAWLAVLDLFWPLSMIGMFAIGVKLLISGRWKGVARFWPAVAESWAFVAIPAMAVFGQGTVTDLVGGVHLLVGYVTLGLIIAARPALTGAR